MYVRGIEEGEGQDTDDDNDDNEDDDSEDGGESVIGRDGRTPSR